jgi:hypothetical protein
MPFFRVEKFPKRLEVLGASHEDSPSIKYFGMNSVGFVSGEPWKKQRKVRLDPLVAETF